MKKLFILFFVLLPLFAQELYFMPYQAKPALKRLLRQIDQSHHSIWIAIYSFTNKTIAKRLKNAAKRGVHVTIVADEEQNRNNPYSQIGYLAKYRHIDIYTIKGRYNKKREYYGKMHMKLAIFDNNWVVFGSANWSYSAFSKNYELIYFTKSFALAKKSKEAIKRMLREAKPY